MFIFFILFSSQRLIFPTIPDHSIVSFAALALRIVFPRCPTINIWSHFVEFHHCFLGMFIFLFEIVRSMSLIILRYRGFLLSRNGWLRAWHQWAIFSQSQQLLKGIDFGVNGFVLRLSEEAGTWRMPVF